MLISHFALASSHRPPTGALPLEPTGRLPSPRSPGPALTTWTPFHCKTLGTPMVRSVCFSVCRAHSLPCYSLLISAAPHRGATVGAPPPPPNPIPAAISEAPSRRYRQHSAVSNTRFRDCAVGASDARNQNLLRVYRKQKYGNER